MKRTRKAQIVAVLAGVALALVSAPAVAEVFKGGGVEPPGGVSSGAVYNSFRGVGAADMTGYASPTGSCRGSLVFTKAIGAKYPGKPFGYLNVYYNGSTGTNCAKAVSSSRTWGKQKPMSVGIYKCRTSTPDRRCRVVDFSEDRPGPKGPGAAYGPYEVYAGPVRVSARDRCIAARGDIIWNGNHGFALTPHYPKSSLCD